MSKKSKLNENKVLQLAKRMAVWEMSMDWDYLHENERQSFITQARDALKKGVMCKQ